MHGSGFIFVHHGLSGNRCIIPKSVGVIPTEAERQRSGAEGSESKIAGPGFLISQLRLASRRGVTRDDTKGLWGDVSVSWHSVKYRFVTNTKAPRRGAARGGHAAEGQRWIIR